MALAYKKPGGWSFSKYLYAYQQSTLTMHGHWWFSIKQVLVDLGWEVRGGCNSYGGIAHNTNEAFGAWSGVDPWVSQASLRRSSGDYYIIMRSPQTVGGNAEVCFGSQYAGNNSTYGDFHFMYFSHAAGFGSANGGANQSGSGSTVTPATATDMQVVVPINTSNDNGLSTAATFSTYGAQSADNKSTRIMIQRQRVSNYWFSFEHLENPHANLDNGGRIFANRYSSSIDPNDAVMLNTFYTSALYYGRVSGVNRSLYAGTNGYANLGHQSLNVVPQDGKMVLAPMDIYNNTNGEKGYYGTIPDLYYGNNEHFMQLLGDSPTGAPNWFSGGSIVSPWDGDISNGGANPEPLPRVY
jgi:hypothetical protein